MNLMKYFSDKRVGIKSAIIAGIFVIIAAFITGSFTIISSYITNSRNSEILKALKEYSKITNRFDLFQQRYKNAQDINYEKLFEILYLKEEIEFKMTISRGWNMIAFPLLLKQVEIANITTTMGSPCELYEYKGEAWFHTKNISYKKGYALYSVENGILIMKGFYPPSSNIHLSKGWNLVGYPSLAERLVEDAFEGIENKIAIIIYKKNGIDYINIQNMNNKKQKSIDKYEKAKRLEVLIPGCSYFLYTFEPVIWRIEN